MRQRDIVITGPGRSGTTLTCHLLNKLPNTIALHEPIAPGRYAKRLPDHEAVCDGIEDFYREQRENALKNGRVLSKHVGGVVPDNPKGFVDGVRQRIVDKGEIPVGKPLSDDFSLAIKDVGMFTAILPTLSRRLPSYAIIRNPLAIMASQSTLKPQVNTASQSTPKPQAAQVKKERKNPNAVVRYDPEFMERRQRIKDPTERQVFRFQYFFEQYVKTLPEENIIRYEDIVATSGKALSVILPEAGELDEPLENQNTNSIYSLSDELASFAEKLLESDGEYWRFYSRESVEDILASLDERPAL